MTAGRTEALLEREQDRARVELLAASASAGRGAVAVVLGPAGIGKTSLLRSARQHAAQVGLRCLAARGAELEREFPFGVTRQLFEPALAGLGPRQRASLFDGAASLAATVLSSEEDVVGEPSMNATLHGLYWLSVGLAERGPLAIVVDDMHWADESSLRFLAYLAHRVEELPVLILAAARPPAGGGESVLVSRLVSSPDTVAIAPRPLSLDGVARLAMEVLGRVPEPTLVRACHEATGGNPMLCVTLLPVLDEARGQGVESDALVRRATRAISSVVVDRLGHLSTADSAIVGAVAVLGGDATLRHVAELAELDPTAAALSADALLARGILRHGECLGFSHPMVGEAVRDRIPPGRRALLHGRAARMLGAEGVAPERIAAHHLLAEPGSDQRVVESLRRAARRVVAQGDPGTAATFLDRARREPPDEQTRPAVLHELGAVQLHSGEPQDAVTTLAAAYALTAEPLARAAIARDLCLAHTTTGGYSDAVALLEATIAEDAPAGHDLLLRLEAELHQSAMMQPDLYTAKRDRLDRLDADVPGDSPGERAALAALATETCLRTGPADRVRMLARRAFDRGLLDDQSAYSSLWGNAAFPLIFADGFDDAAAVAARAIEHATRRGSRVGSARAYAVSSTLSLRLGAIRDAESEARIATDLGLQAGYAVSLLPLGVLVEALVEQGELQAAQDALCEAGRDGAIAERFLESWVLHARGRLRLAQGRIADAVADLEELGRRGVEGWRPWNPGIFCYRTDLALCLHRHGDIDGAVALAREELDLARRWSTDRATGIALRVLGQVLGGAEGLGYLSESVGILSRSPARMEHARSLVALGAAVRRGGRRNEAREPLREGMAIAHECGGRALVALAREELLAAGGRPRRMARRGVDALTPSELRVARMAADGLTNREIAQALFVTLRTVQVHLTGCYRKLGINSREGLPEALTSQAGRHPPPVA